MDEKGKGGMENYGAKLNQSLANLKTDKKWKNG
jgi:hypothetical protein